MKKSLMLKRWNRIKCFLGFHKWQFWTESTKQGNNENDLMGNIRIKFCERCTKEKRIDHCSWNID